ncbi:MAG: sigma-70 family RNA polymerase sigma factor [Chloroflexi bacterium]|nr:sigma-70 family RNA polymerase sigma factor [Chloroflexota bacterium]
MKNEVHEEQDPITEIEAEPAEAVTEELLGQAEEQGYITYDEILFSLPNAEERLDLLEDLFAQLHERGIDVWEDRPQRRGQPPKQDVGAPDLSDVPVGDPTDLYFREMGREPLLTAEEEVELAKAVIKGIEAAERLAKEDGRLSAKKIETLKKVLQEGEAARRRLIRANTRLVISVAKRYIGQGVPFLDLVQEGNLGLMKAVDKFDYERGYKFSTYATWWIRQAVSRAVSDQGRTIRLPVHIGDKLRLLHRASRELEQDQGRPATPEEIAGTLEVAPDRVRRLLRLSRRPLSLEQPVGEEEETMLGNFIADDEAPPPPAMADNALLREELEEILETLQPREARILRLRFGLQDGRSYTLEEVGQKFGLTRERIRQIEAHALNRLRHPSRSRRLRDFID